MPPVLKVLVMKVNNTRILLFVSAKVEFIHGVQSLHERTDNKRENAKQIRFC